MMLIMFIQGIDGMYIKCDYPKALLDDDDLMEDIHSHYSQQQGENSWDAMRYIIDPTLGTFNRQKRVDTRHSTFNCRSQFEAFGGKNLALSNVLHVY